jgi:hypothetical protein
MQFKVTENVTNVIPAQISMESRESMYGKNVLIATWGKSNNGVIPKVLEAADLVVLSKNECEKRYMSLSGKRLNLPNGLMCTAADPYVLATIVSIGFYCNHLYAQLFLYFSLLANT